MSKIRAFIQAIGSPFAAAHYTFPADPNSSLGPNPKQSLSSMRFVVLDTETTGFKPYNRDRVLSLGAVVLEDGKVNEQKTFYELVNPQRPVPEKVIELTGITGKMVESQPPLAEILSHFLSWMGNPVLAGHVINFDLAFLNHCHLKHYGRKITTTKPLDTRKLSGLLIPGLKTYALEEICAHLKIECCQRHHALSDAIASARILEFCLNELAGFGVNTLEDLYAFIRCRQSMPGVFSPVGC